MISSALNTNVSYPFEVLDQGHCSVDGKYEEKIRREIFSIASFDFTRHSLNRNDLVRAKSSSFYLDHQLANEKTYICQYVVRKKCVCAMLLALSNVHRIQGVPLIFTLHIYKRRKIIQTERLIKMLSTISISECDKEKL